jgi:hypothetical protein
MDSLDRLAAARAAYLAIATDTIRANFTAICALDPGVDRLEFFAGLEEYQDAEYETHSHWNSSANFTSTRGYWTNPGGDGLPAVHALASEIYALARALAIPLDLKISRADL